jgi:exopolysaccharide production protein ExoZ
MLPNWLFCDNEESRRMARQITSLQVGRALAASIVVFTHATGFAVGFSDRLSVLGARFGVFLFFVISGFIIVRSSGEGPFDPLAFLRKRVLRVCPPYYIATVVAIVGVLLLPSAFKDTVFDLKHIVMSLFFIPMYEPGSTGEITPFLKLGWTLNYEMYFYVLFAALYMLTLRRRAQVLTVFLICMFVGGMLLRPEAAIPVYYMRVEPLAFLFGIWLATLRADERPLLPAWILAAAVAVSFCFFAAYYNPRASSDAMDIWIMLTCAASLSLMLGLDEAIRRYLPAWMVTLGDSSYSIYLFHMFGVGLAFKLGTHVVGAEHAWLLVLPAFVVGIGVGMIAYYFVERPALRFFGYRGARERREAERRARQATATAVDVDASPGYRAVP